MSELYFRLATLLFVLGCSLSATSIQAQSGNIRDADVYSSGAILTIAINEQDSTTIELYDSDEVLLATLNAPTGVSRIADIAWNSTGDQLAVVYSDSIPRVIVWNVTTQQIVRDQSVNFARFVKWHPLDSNILAISTGNSIIVYNALSDQSVDSGPITGSSISQLEWRPDGLQIATLTESGELQIRSAQTLFLVLRLGDETVPVGAMSDYYFSFAWNPSGDRIAVYDVLGTEIEIWTLSGQLETSFASFDNTPEHYETLAWSEMGVIGANFALGTIVIYDPMTSQFDTILSSTQFLRFYMDREHQDILYIPTTFLAGGHS